MRMNQKSELPGFFVTETVSKVLYHSLFGTPTTKAVGFHFVTNQEPTALVVGVPAKTSKLLKNELLIQPPGGEVNGNADGEVKQEFG